MELNGRQLYFAYTVGAKREADNLIAAHGGQNLNDLLGGSPEDQEAGTCGMILILSKWGEKLHAAEEPGYEPRPITAEELDLVPLNVHAALYNEALAAMVRDSRREVEAEAPQQAQKKTEAGGPSS